MSMSVMSVRVFLTPLSESIVVSFVLESPPPIPRLIVPITMIISIHVPQIVEFLELASSNVSNLHTRLLTLTGINVSIVV